MGFSNFNSRPREGANDRVKLSPVDHLISIPAPARGRTFYSLHVHTPGYFNSRPREGANVRRELALDDVEISIPAPARGRTEEMEKMVEACEFQFPPPRGGEPHPECHAGNQRIYFNSRPREGANDNILDYFQTRLISIPAPARGRTPPITFYFLEI